MNTDPVAILTLFAVLLFCVVYFGGLVLTIEVVAVIAVIVGLYGAWLIWGSL